ncbi:MAG: TIR domain-containing protein, partial [Anaerolineales bacterium]
MTGRIFISYRRADSQYATDRIYERLEAHFGSENVFMDIDDIPLGVNFRVYIDQQVSTSDIVLAVIGDHWLDSTDPEGNLRLQNPSDFVRLEIEAALKQGIKLIPLFIGGVQAVPESKLPESLQELPMLNATRIRRGKDFLPDVDRLIRGIERINADQAAQRAQNKAALAELNDSAAEIINRLNTFEALMIQDMRKRTQLEKEAQQLKERVREHLGDPKKQLRVDVGLFREQVEKLQDNLMELALQIEERKQTRALEEQRSAAQKQAEERAERERLAKNIAKKKIREKEIAEADRIAREKVEADRIEREKAEAERRAREKVEAERKAKEIAEKKRKAKEIAEAERIAKQKAEAERKARQKAEAQRKAKESAERAAQRREQLAQLKASVGKVPIWAWAAVAVVVLGIIFGPMVWNGITSIVSSSQTPDFVKTWQTYIDENPPDFE